MQTFTSRHVPELDGLRGIAIISVVIHHQLTPFLLPGGFLGVDLFFVLSGFLITGLLLTEFDKTKTISLRKFYMRRVLRLGPALFLYLVACLLVAYQMHVIELTRQLKLIGLALIYSTNWRMAFGWDPILDNTAIIWSLSIEEQFYLVWPLLFFACLTFKMRRGFIVTALAIVIVAIMAHRYLLLSAGAGLTRLYYGTDTRADALLIGCLLAMLPAKATGVRLKSWLSIAGVLSAAVLLYLIATATFSDQFLYRGGYTAIALLAGIVILVAADSPPCLLAVALRWSVLRWFGKISYGLYLWHWLVIRSTSFYYLGYWEPWARLAFAIGIAAASFYLVEKPFNRLKTRFLIEPLDSQSRSPLPPLAFTADQSPSSLSIATTN